MLTHGGDLVGFAAQFGSAPLDFSVNTNPFGLSPLAAAALPRAAARACEYPDPLYRRLRAAIADHEELPASQIACGNGAADLIWRIVLALRPKHALITAPTFSEYEAALQFAGCRVHHYDLLAENDFLPDSGILSHIHPDTDLVFLCNPNNPTGLTTAPALLERILKQCRNMGARLIVDECFLRFLPDAAEKTMKPYLNDHKELLILKAFTKFYGMAGLRLGYCLCADADLLTAIGAAGQCWPVSIAAEEAGIAALQDHAFSKATIAYFPAERARMKRAMEQLGLRVWPGEANYLFFYTDIPNYWQLLAEQGFLLRDCSNYRGLTEGYYRTAILTPEKNDLLLAAMAKIRRNQP